MSFGSRLRTYFFTGVIVTAPISITIYLAWSFIGFVDEKVALLVPSAYHPDRYLPFSVPGLGLIVVICGLILVGFLTANFLGRSLIRISEKILSRMPVVRSVYSALKQLFETVLAQSSSSFRQVVAVEFPRAGSWAIAFLAGDGVGEVARRLDKDMITVFVPTSPNPTSGYLMVVPRSDAIFLDMTVEEGMKFVVSGGMVLPSDRGPIGAGQPALPLGLKSRS
ncbi:MAG: DUF502 domain-containing protein [Alphaproteobacteria bacterium]|nr:DUF502 domain-containing protein [Alphaproteobacteria bacterium]